MTRNPNSHSHQEEAMEALTEFENKIVLASPQPRSDFQQELAGRLHSLYAQRQFTQPPRRYRKLSVRTVVILAAVVMAGIGAVIAMNTYF